MSTAMQTVTRAAERLGLITDITQSQGALGTNATADLEVQANGAVLVRTFSATIIVYLNVMLALA
ncbi:MAG TPA: hypothetical protein VGI28_01705 [Stellaceae bacterium]|jgi:hypothetical protein